MLYLDGIAKVTPFVYDTLIGYNQMVDARGQTSGEPRLHVLVVVGQWTPTAHDRRAQHRPNLHRDFNAGTRSSARRPSSRSGSSTPQTPQTTVSTAFGQAQTAGNLNVVRRRLEQRNSNIASVTDTPATRISSPRPTTRSGGAI